MTATAIPTRMLVLLGAALAAAAAFLVARPLLLSDDGGSTASTAAPPAATPATPTTPTPTPATPAAKPTPKVTLLPGLPKQVAKQLRYSKVVVVAVYTGTAKGDRAAVTQARLGAKQVGAGFVAMNVLRENTARELARFVAGTASPPLVLLVKRPGKVVNQFETSVDSALVAQAARNAGARR